jgi:dienelactone hydrolase
VSRVPGFHHRERVRVFAVFFLLFLARPASAQNLGDNLDFGRHWVGFEEKSGISIWYPCARVAEGAMALRDYSSDRGAGLTELMASAGISSAAIGQYLSAPMRARRGAPRARRSFPLVLLAVGNAQDALDHAVLAEYLASHGYVVASTPSPMLHKPMKSAVEIPLFAEEQASDLAEAISIVSRMREVKSRRIVAIGYSFGARAALRLAMRDSKITGIVSIDGGIGTASGAASIENPPPGPPKRLPAILHFYGDVDPFMRADFAFLEAVPARSLRKELAHGMRHAHFTTMGYGSVMIPEIARLTKAPGDVAATLRRVASQTLNFVRQHD